MRSSTATRYPVISTAGAMLALRAHYYLDSDAGWNARGWNPERMAHEFSTLERLARSFHGLQIERCNRPMTERDERRDLRLRKDIVAKVEECYCFRAEVEFGGDPRGCVVELTLHSRDGRTRKEYIG